MRTPRPLIKRANISYAKKKKKKLRENFPIYSISHPPVSEGQVKEWKSKCNRNGCTELRRKATY